MNVILGIITWLVLGYIGGCILKNQQNIWSADDETVLLLISTILGPILIIVAILIFWIPKQFENCEIFYPKRK